MQAAPSESNEWKIPSRPSVYANRVSRPWRILTAFCAVMLLLGYLILSVVFGRTDEILRVDRTASAVFALFFVAVSYTASVVIAYFQRKRKLFLLRSLFMPYVVINLLALFNVLFNVFARGLPLNALRVVGIGLPSAFSLIYGLAAFLIYREYGPSQSSGAEDGTPLLGQEEMQRRQLLRLLQERNSGVLSPHMMDNTYHLDGFIPGLEPMPKTWDRQLRPPTSRNWSDSSQALS